MIKFGLDKNQQYCKVCRLPEQDDLQMPDGIKPILKAFLFHVYFPQNKNDRKRKA